MSKLEGVWDYVHDAINNDKLTFILITSAAEGKIEAEGFQFGMGKTTLAAGIAGRIFEKYHSLGKYEAEELVKNIFGYTWEHMRDIILKGYEKRQLVYVADDLQQVAGKHLTHNQGVKWMAYQMTTKRPQLAVFIATCPHIGSLAKCWRELFDWEIKVPIRGYYEVQQIKTRTIFKDPLNPLKFLRYKGEAEFPKASEEFEKWYIEWRNVYNEEEFVRGWDEYFGIGGSEISSMNITQRQFNEILREVGIKGDDHKFLQARQKLLQIAPEPFLSPKLQPDNLSLNQSLNMLELKKRISESYKFQGFRVTESYSENEPDIVIWRDAINPEEVIAIKKLS